MLRTYYKFLAERARAAGSRISMELGGQLVPWAFFACIVSGFSFVMDLTVAERLFLLLPMAAITVLGMAFVAFAFLHTTWARTNAKRDDES